MYNSEAEFRKALCNKLEQAAWFTQKIEAEGMNVGIPDLFVGKNWVQIFMELKLEKKPAPKPGQDLLVHWRPGQQAWAMKYYKRVRKSVWTVIQYINCIALVRNGSSMYQGGKVPYTHVQWFNDIADLIEFMEDLQ